MDNAWRPVPGYEGQYEVSDHGRVRTLSNRWGRVSVMHPSTVGVGHQQVGLTKDGRRRMHYVHVLMMAAFVGPKPDGLEVRHLDGDPANNTLANLRYGTRQENSQDRINHGRHDRFNQTHCIAGHEFTEENTYHPPKRPTRRYCKTCRAAAVRRYAERKRGRVPSL